ncbi:WhiB family transcriptional regulator [Amycolatopsis regifaucium]|uniref:Transcriptional regulator WhiB n=1 Tax=Amycolatopsis regifaucium TaxID=546365 RepID=A0A154MBR5_9PSEU|nr:WhiB family transcriptional regulator [Amycolatopsis regifaucium]KZB81733.1 transcription factor WhiB [Amycolatopsis regifaucium]OKA06200.1 transcription factor WhiB [Amycolatopsis regifaucium]SFG69672.1 WhiB family transcriptional regulator, redox-sensing transcriptional regulator [Amycolatopsis regifaucium]
MADVSRLPNVVAEEWDWQLRGSCRGADSSLFFHTDNERGSARERRESRAKAICQTCPVLAQCRKHALAVQEPYGIWGGLGEIERRELFLRERRAGRQALTAR